MSNNNTQVATRITDYQHIGGSYYVYAIMTRFGDVTWFVEDRLTPCEDEPTLPAIVRQCDTYEAAIKDFIFD